MQWHSISHGWWMRADYDEHTFAHVTNKSTQVGVYSECKEHRVSVKLSCAVFPDVWRNLLPSREPLQPGQCQLPPFSMSLVPWAIRAPLSTGLLSHVLCQLSAWQGCRGQTNLPPLWVRRTGLLITTFNSLNNDNTAVRFISFNLLPQSILSREMCCLYKSWKYI